MIVLVVGLTIVGLPDDFRRPPSLSRAVVSGDPALSHVNIRLVANFAAAMFRRLWNGRAALSVSSGGAVKPLDVADMRSTQIAVRDEASGKATNRKVTLRVEHALR